MNALAMSVYGTEPRYLVGAVENARLARTFYPGWRVMIWAGKDVPESVNEELRGTGADMRAIPGWCTNGMMARFLVHDEPWVERYIVRDVDSRLSRREMEAVDDWIKAGTTLHIMKDHPFHCQQPIMGGMFGWRRRQSERKLEPAIRAHAHKTAWGEDIKLLAMTLLPWAKSWTIHDSCGERNWPPKGKAFVGEYVDAEGRPNQEHRRIRWEELRRFSAALT